MEFEWNEKKRLETIETRGVDFADAALIFENPTIDRPDTRFDYPEPRTISLGIVDETAYVVVHCMSEDGEAIRIISAWKGGRKRYDKYNKIIAKRDQSKKGDG